MKHFVRESKVKESIYKVTDTMKHIVREVQLKRAYAKGQTK